MSNRRSITDFPRNEAGLVDDFIGTAYDVVKGVYDALPELTDLSEQIDQIPNLAINAVEAAMVPARAEIGNAVDVAKNWAQSPVNPDPLDPYSKSAKTWAGEAEQFALDANKINRVFPFVFNELQSVYDVTVISGRTDVTTAGMALWIEGAIDYNFVINSMTQFTMTDMASIPQGAAMRLMVNARFDDLGNNLVQLQETFQEEFDEAQASRDAEFQEFLENSDYEIPVLYQPGLVLSRPSQTVMYQGYVYRVDTLYIPLTTTNWAADSPKMKLVGDASLRDDLLDPAKAGTAVAWQRDLVLKPSTALGYVLSLRPINIWEYAHLAVGFGVEPDSRFWDWAPAIQAASDAIRTRVNTFGPGTQNVIEFPGSRYPVKGQVKISAFAKLKAEGLVIFQTEVANDSAFHFTPSPGDYNDNSTIIRKQQWFRGPFINGQSGGFVFHNALEKAGCTAIEIGPRTDISELSPFSRYSACDFAVEGYAAAMKFNRFRNYIGSFERVHLENNTELCVFGDVGGAVVLDSGENIHFSDSVFAIAESAFRWHCDGFDINLTNCSYDFIGTIFRFSRLYKKITVNGGHMEGIGGTRAHDGIGGLVLEESVTSADNGTLCYVNIAGVSGYILPGRMIRGSNKVHVQLDFEFRKSGVDNTPDKVFFCSDAITVRKQMIINQHRSTLPSWSTNMLRNPVFALDAVGALASAGSPPIGWAVVAGGSPATISADASSLGGKSIKIVGNPSGNYFSMTNTDKLPCKPGDVVLANLFVKFAVGSLLSQMNASAVVLFYDSADTLIMSTPESLNDMGGSSLIAGQYCLHAYSRNGVAPKGTAYFKVRLGVTGQAMNNADTYVTGFYTTVLN